MHSYLTAFFWGWVILLAMFGWGSLLLRLCRFSKDIDLGWQGALGVAFSVTAGGVFNYFRLVSRGSVIIFLSAGLIFTIISLALGFSQIKEDFKNFRQSLKNHKALIALVVFILLAVFVRYAFSTAFFNFNVIDDQHAYLVFPVKMIQTGSLGQDPFSERRLLTSLGGQYFLDTFILAGAQIKNLHLMDNAAGLIIFLLVLLGLAKDRKLSTGATLFVVALAAIIPSPTTNVTSFFTSAALFLALLRFLAGGDKDWPGKTDRLVVLALLSAAACALKSNFTLPVVVLYCAYFIFELKLQRKTWAVIREFALATILVLLFLLPWMLSMLKSSGSLFYPYLGKGNGAFINSGLAKLYLEINIYGLYRVASEVVIGLGIFLPFVVLIWAWLRGEPGKSRKVALTALFASVIGLLALIYGNGGYSLYYYSFSFLVPAILFVLVLILEKGNIQFSAKFAVPAAALSLVCGALLFGVYIQQDIGIFQDMKTNVNIDKGSLKFGLINSDLIPAPELQQYAALQQAVPAGALMLARLDRNFVFDFNRNPIYILDSPGIVSPAPGLPYGQGSEAVAKYFLSHGARYLAYSYGNQANFSPATAGTMLMPHVNPLLKSETLASFDFQNNLSQLGQTRKRIYDDGSNFVLDLATLNK